MENLTVHILPMLALVGLITGCSGMGTTMTNVGRLRQNKGYEIPAEMPMVQQAAMDVLKARGYEVSLKPDPENGAEGAGQIVIGQRVVKYNATSASATETAPSQMDTRDLIDVYLSKKWHMSDSTAVLNITLVEIVGGNYIRKGPGATEVETPLTKDFVGLLRDEIDRAVTAARNVKPVVK